MSIDEMDEYDGQDFIMAREDTLQIRSSGSTMEIEILRILGLNGKV